MSKPFTLKASSLRAVKEALEEKIKSFPADNRGENKSRPYRIALKEIKRQEK